MRKIVLTLVLSVTLISASASANSFGSAFGTMTTAKAMGQGIGDFGFGAGLTDNATSFFGTFAYGLSTNSDGRLKLGLYDPDGGGDTKIVLGADYKWQFWNYDKPTEPGQKSRYPFDFAVGGFLEYYDLEGASVLEVGGQLIASIPISFDNGSTLTPYGRFNARLEAISWDYDIPGVDGSESNLEVGINGGVQWQMTSTVALYGEFQLDGNDGLIIGIDFNVM